MKRVFITFSIIALIMLLTSSCEVQTSYEPQSSSGVSKASVQVQTDDRGNTVEQKNIMERLKRDNLPGSIKHLYVISAYSGQVIIYSTVKGKVTSSSKRLTPNTVAAADDQYTGGIPIGIGNRIYRTGEVLGDDGSYGSSDPYIYWFDIKGVYHQHYISGGQIIHISDQPISVKSVIINMEVN